MLEQPMIENFSVCGCKVWQTGLRRKSRTPVRGS